MQMLTLSANSASLLFGTARLLTFRYPLWPAQTLPPTGGRSLPSPSPHKACNSLPKVERSDRGTVKRLELGEKNRFEEEWMEEIAVVGRGLKRWREVEHERRRAIRTEERKGEWWMRRRGEEKRKAKEHKGRFNGDVKDSWHLASWLCFWYNCQTAKLLAVF